jgi:hypothetical protein
MCSTIHCVCRALQIQVTALISIKVPCSELRDGCLDCEFSWALQGNAKVMPQTWP